jgi:hypothetical protein
MKQVIKNNQKTIQDMNYKFKVIKYLKKKYSK